MIINSFVVWVICGEVNSEENATVPQLEQNTSTTANDASFQKMEIEEVNRKIAVNDIHPMTICEALSKNGEQLCLHT